MQTTRDELKSKIENYYNQNQTRLTIGFFVGGFLFDLLTLSNIDDTFSLLQQVIYLFLIGYILVSDFLVQNGQLQISPRFEKLWSYRQLIVHFLFGSLLSIYSIFYFKSSSILSSFVFIIVMSAILVANELSRVQNAGQWLRFSMYALCLNAFFSFIYPVLLGFIGWIPFILSVATTAGTFYFVSKIFLKRGIPLSIIKKRCLGPILAVQIAFVFFYMVGWIPPVPVSAEFMGIYHKIEKESGVYKLYHQKPVWKFWQNGDQDFYARAGEPVYFFTNIYSPARFSDQVKIRWMNKDPRLGWQTWDLIDMKISGGREEGFRGYTYKSNYQEGDWRIQIETTDGREIGRISFTVYTDLSTEEREYKIDEK